MKEQYIVALITFVITFIGTVCNATVFIIAKRLHSMKSSFGIITRNQALSNTIMCLIFLLYVFPLHITDNRFFIRHSHYVGVVAMTVYEVSNQCHLLLALNRLFAVFVPSYYSVVFSETGTKWMRNIIWMISIAMCVTLYEIIACHFYYDDISWLLTFIPSKKCVTLTWYSDFTFNTTLVVITLTTNLITAFKAGRNNRMLMDAAGIKMSKRQRQREMNFIKQTFFQGTTIFMGQVTYYVIAPYVSNNILLFFISSLWAFMHAAEGVIILASNHEMRSYMVRRIKNQKASGTTFMSSVSIGTF